LFDNNVLEQRFISLASLASDTVIFMWTAPVATLMDGELTIHSELSGDEIPANNECRITITIAGPALAGHYEIGGPVPDFTALSDAAMHLSYRGVAGPVDILVHAGDYVDAATFAPIPGTSAAAVVTIHGPDSLNRPVISYPAGEELLLVDGASFLEFAHLELYGPPESWAVVRIRAGSDGVRVSDCVIHGTDSTASYSYGISVDDGGCDANEILNCVIHGAFTGIGLNGSSGTSSGNRVQGCHVLNARYGISVLRQTAAVIDGNDIEAGFATNFVAPCYGIYVGNLGTGGSVTINGNVLHRFADHSGSTSNRAVGIYSAPSGAATATITNNFIFGFDDILNVKINGIYLSAGTNTVYHNSILLGNAPGVNEVACVYISTGSSHTLLNNILVSRATEVTSYGIQHASGDGLISDYNLIYGTSPVFVTGRLGATSYVNLAQWQGAAFDLQGMAAEPGFVSETDLHIRADSSVVDGQGVSIPGVLFDIDGESRSDPPDLGADEYDFAPIPNAVVDLRAIMSMDGLLLQWSPSPGVLSYRVYASANMDTIFAPENLIATVSTTSYVEPNPGAVSRAYYVVTADTAP
jgi:hypothetical protein